MSSLIIHASRVTYKKIAENFAASIPLPNKIRQNQFNSPGRTNSVPLRESLSYLFSDYSSNFSHSFPSAFFSILDTYSPVKLGLKINQLLIKSFPIFRTIDFCKKAPLLSHLQIPAYTLTELFCKNYTTLQIKSGIAPSVACQIVLKSIVYIVLFCYNWTIYFTQFS